jgi:hypothetical protein
MSVHAIEKVLWLIGNDRHEAQKFVANAGDYLATFRLTTEETSILESLEAGALARLGINTLLLLGAYRAIRGPDSIGDYMRSMNTP